MSIAIVPMAHEYGWSSGVSGIVQSAFFWGYVLCQLPSGYLSSQLGGRSVMSAGVGTWSLATAVLPLVAGTTPGLCLSRAVVGMGEAVAPSAATDIVARLVPKEERSRAVATVFSGLHIGSIVGLLLAPQLITHFGWQWVFVIFGAFGGAWVLWFEQLMSGIAVSDPQLANRLMGQRQMTVSTRTAPAGGGAADQQAGPAVEALATVPYRAFLRNSAVRVSAEVLVLTPWCRRLHTAAAVPACCVMHVSWVNS